MKYNYCPVQTTPFSKIEKIKARLWRLVWFLFYRPTPWFLYRYRVFLLNLFGADVAYSARPANSAFIEYPWNLFVADHASLGERSWIYCLDKISIRRYACVGQDVKLVTGSHNPTSSHFEMVTAPISIGEGCWLTSDLTVLMGVTIGDYTVVGVRSLVVSSLPENIIAFGSPAVVVRKRFDANE